MSVMKTKEGYVELGAGRGKVSVLAVPRLIRLDPKPLGGRPVVRVVPFTEPFTTDMYRAWLENSCARFGVEVDRLCTCKDGESKHDRTTKHRFTPSGKTKFGKYNSWTV